MLAALTKEIVDNVQDTNRKKVSANNLSGEKQLPVFDIRTDEHLTLVDCSRVPHILTVPA